MSAHTPGPWRAVEWRVCDSDGAIESCGKQVVDANGHSIDSCTLEDENEANVYLIAAAPELLALLIESQDSIGGDWRERRDAAIAKATGRRP